MVSAKVVLTVLKIVLLLCLTDFHPLLFNAKLNYIVLNLSIPTLKNTSVLLIRKNASVIKYYERVFIMGRQRKL